MESTEPCVQLASETCQLLQGSDTSVLPVPQRCVRRLLSLLSTAQTSLTSNSALSESRPLQISQSQPKTSPKTHSSRLPSYSNTSGSRGRSCKGECPFPVVHLLNVIPPTHCVSAQSDQAASWQIKECPKGRHLAESMLC